ncbi:MAG: LytTR family transcriptional regulator DNA-binding domain-containing protein [Turicibacter sp.]|nr:LytTR family transcriptional regulator DNA-binding domain-containing protein [Turicibacter sp.]
MESILIVTNDYIVEPEVLELLAKDYHVLVASDEVDEFDIIDKTHIDVFMIMSEKHINDATWDLFCELDRRGRELTPVIFVSETLDEELNARILQTGYQYFTHFPFDHDELIGILKNAMLLASKFYEKVVILEKNRIEFHHPVKRITHIKKIEKRWVRIFYLEGNEEKSDDYPYDAPLGDFPKRHGVEHHLKQAHQSWLVNPAYIKAASRVDTEITLETGSKVPIGGKFLSDFTKKKKKKEKE